MKLDINMHARDTTTSLGQASTPILVTFSHTPESTSTGAAASSSTAAEQSKHRKVDLGPGFIVIIILVGLILIAPVTFFGVRYWRRRRARRLPPSSHTGGARTQREAQRQTVELAVQGMSMRETARHASQEETRRDVEAPSFAPESQWAWKPTAQHSGHEPAESDKSSELGGEDVSRQTPVVAYK